MCDFVNSNEFTEISIINESTSRGMRSRVFGVSHASGLGGCTRSTKCIARLDLAVSIHSVQAEGDERRTGRGGGGGGTRERESLAITAALLLRSMVANLYDKQPVLGVHACNRVYTYTYVAGVPVNKHPGINNARPCHSGPCLGERSRVTVSRHRATRTKSSPLAKDDTLRSASSAPGRQRYPRRREIPASTADVIDFDFTTCRDIAYRDGHGGHDGHRRCSSRKIHCNWFAVVQLM